MFKDPRVNGPLSFSSTKLFGSGLSGQWHTGSDPSVSSVGGRDAEGRRISPDDPSRRQDGEAALVLEGMA